MVDGTATADRFSDYIGRPYEDVVAELKAVHTGKVVAVPAGGMVTADYDLSRIRVRYDETGLTVSVRMG